MIAVAIIAFTAGLFVGGLCVVTAQADVALERDVYRRALVARLTEQEPITVRVLKPGQAASRLSVAVSRN